MNIIEGFFRREFREVKASFSRVALMESGAYNAVNQLHVSLVDEGRVVSDVSEWITNQGEVDIVQYWKHPDDIDLNPSRDLSKTFVRGVKISAKPEYLGGIKVDRNLSYRSEGEEVVLLDEVRYVRPEVNIDVLFTDSEEVWRSIMDVPQEELDTLASKYGLEDIENLSIREKVNLASSIARHISVDSWIIKKPDLKYIDGMLD